MKRHKRAYCSNCSYFDKSEGTDECDYPTNVYTYPTYEKLELAHKVRPWDKNNLGKCEDYCPINRKF